VKTSSSLFIRPKADSSLAAAGNDLSKSSVRARSRARRALVQALYKWHMTGAASVTIQKEFEDGEALNDADAEFFSEGLSRIILHTAVLDDQIAPLLDRAFKDLDPIEMAILRLGADELLHRTDVPYRVVINEYVELAKTFGAEESHKYINGVLDKLARSTRTVEVAARRNPGSA
jgi:transcription antitermination protein NusB